jgi:peptidoglycan/xylan/chitin deacetylase (PgdA/CDA1 family)
MSARDLGVAILSATGIAGMARRVLAGGGRFAINFHGVSSRRYPNAPRDLHPHFSVAEFRQALAWLAQRFRFLTVQEFLSGAQPGVLLTFDDGHANNLTNALPLLEEFDAQGLFFIATQHVREPRNWLSFTRESVRRGWGAEYNVPDDFARDCLDGLSEGQLAELGRSPRAVIGSHTVSHPSLPGCPLAQVRRELQESRRYLQEVSGQAVHCFAYPYGDYNRQVAGAVKEAGYRAAFAVDPVPVGMPAYEIPRVAVYSASPGYLSVKLSGLHRQALRGRVPVESPF